MGHMTAVMRRFGTRSTQFVGKHWGERFPFFYVSEFPRSGGTWLSQMIADYLEIPKPSDTVFPMGCKCVVQNHWGFTAQLRRVFYLFRDGRDVCISSYFFALRALRSNDKVSTGHILRKYPGALRENWTEDNCRESLVSFVRRWVTAPVGTRIPWGKHVSQWAFDRPHVVTVSYEELLRDCVGTLSRIIPIHTAQPVDVEKLEATVRKFTFERQTGRRPGQASALAHNRKGIAGDWKNYFTPEAGELFHRHFGDVLIRLGYEQDDGWYRRL